MKFKELLTENVMAYENKPEVINCFNMLKKEWEKILNNKKLDAREKSFLKSDLLQFIQKWKEKNEI